MRYEGVVGEIRWGMDCGLWKSDDTPILVLCSCIAHPLMWKIERGRGRIGKEQGIGGAIALYSGGRVH